MLITTENRRQEPLILGRYTAANMVSFAAAAASLGAAVGASRGLIELSMLLLVAAGALDGIDGAIARKFHTLTEDKAFGGQLDALVDLMSWGVVPCLISYTLGLRTATDLIVLYGYIACVTIRLCDFGMHGAETTNGIRYFRGLPSAYVSFLYPMAVALGSLLSPDGFHLALRGTHAVLGFLFIVNIPVRDVRSVAWVWGSALGLPALYWAATWWQLPLG